MKTPPPPAHRGPRDRYRMKRLYLLIMAQSNEERSSGDVISDQQELQGLQDCLGDRSISEEEKGYYLVGVPGHETFRYLHHGWCD